MSAAGCAPGAQLATPTAQTQAPQATLALVNGTLISGTGAQPIPGAVVLIAGERIVAAGPAGQIVVPAGVETVDVGGATILTGFINAHVHYAFDKAHLRAWGQGGVTTVRHESAPVEQISNLKAFQAEISQDPHDARLVSFGSMLAVPGGYGQRNASSAEEARKAVVDEIDEGVGGAKVALEDGYAGTSGLPKLTPEELKAIVETAHAYGILVSGHITQGTYLQAMLDAGVDDIAHLPFDSVAAETFQRMVAQGVYLTPTFTVFRNFGAPVGGSVDNLRQFVGLGGKVALGNDYGGGPGDFELGIPMYEIETMSQGGMTRCRSSRPARRMRRT